MSPDYRTLMDAATWAFIDRVNGFYPPEAIGWAIEENRAVYDRMSRAFHTGRPENVHVDDASSGSPPTRRYRRDEPDGPATVLFLHGGGFVLGGLDSHDDICAEICAHTGFDVVSVGYRLAPEHRDTAAFEDAVEAFERLAERTDGAIVLVGESAGGTLAASLAHAVRSHPKRPAGQVLVYPSLGGSMPKPSRAVHAEAPLLSAADLAFYESVRTDADTRDDPRFEPLGAPDFAGLPPTVIVTAQCDPLASDGKILRDCIRAAGGRAFCFEAQGLPHGFLRGRATVSRAAEAFTVAVEAVRSLGRREWPFEQSPI